ncbi:MAG: low-specificity L-threonine aldolase [Bacteroidota bacterium]|nr:low-specificity L-threonine aldolase [Bacteroidota bacterium]
MSTEKYIDLRSDTVTRPSKAMRDAMANADVGDDVFSEDPTVIKLQEKVAALLGKEKALYVPSGVMSNQLAIKSHTEPGDEIICEQDAHIFNYETAAPSLISSVQVKTIPGAKGVLRVEQLPTSLRPKVYYMPRSRLICLENTHNRAGGTIYPIDEIKKISGFARANGLFMHLDGARLWNAWVATGIHPKEYAKYFDSVSVCFSKGLGAPIGSAIVGPADFIERARKWRKVYGGGMRQAGIIAAGALYALEHNVERLKEDHEKASYFARKVSATQNVYVDLDTVQTNIVLVNVERSGRRPEEIITALKGKGLLVSLGTYTSIRAVMHLDVSMEEVKRAAEIFISTMN